MLLARVAARPHDGAANRALCALVARAAGLAPSRVAVVRGARGREKLLSVSGIAEPELLALLARAGAP